ncbi:transposase [Streptomyces sp. WAC 06738]|uniref:transposase n=1 Tax=Streptomyces sp. WAC 06738 TaxID=2203210 RepID=UPI003204A5F9
MARKAVQEAAHDVGVEGFGEDHEVYAALRADRGHHVRGEIAARDWLTVFQLPPYAPDPNPVEGLWSVLRRTTGQPSLRQRRRLITTVRQGLRKLQYRPDVLDGCLTGTGLRPAPP